jgi:hypothetical protein
MTPNMMPQQGGENEQIVNEIIGLVTQMLEMAGPEWVMQFLAAGMQAVQEGGGQEAMPGEMPGQMPPDMMSPDMMSPDMMPPGRPQAMPAAAPKRGMMGRRIN